MELPAEWVQNSRQNQANGVITLVLEPVNDTFQQKRLTLAEGSSIKIGRMTNKSTTPTDSNGYFDSKVLSRNHAEVTYRNCQVYIKDLKSSNGTFINGKRLSAEGKESSPVELKHGDDLEFGVDIVNEQDKKLMFRKVAAKVSIKRRGNRVPSNTENSLLTMLEAELERARAESRYLSELGSMLNDATNTLDARSKRVSSSDKVIDLRFCEESHVKLEEAQIKLRETEAKLNEAIFIQKEYKDKFMESDKKVIELKERYMNSEKKVIELEQKCTTSEELINELEKTCMASGERVIQLEKKCKESDQKAIELEGKCRESELRIKFLENALQSTFNHPTKTGQFDYLEERLIKITNELSDNKYFLDDTRDQLERTEKELHASQKKCREFQMYETKYNEAMKTIEELRSFEAVASFRNQIGMRDEAFEKFDGERTALLSRIQFLEEAGKKSEAESAILRDQLKKLESLNKNLKEEIESVEQFVNSSQRGLLRRRHKKQDSEPVKEWQMTDDHGVLSFAENLTSNDKMANMKYNKSLLIKGSIGVVVLGIGAWCFSRLYS